MAQKRKALIDSFFSEANQMFVCTLITDFKKLERDRSNEEWTSGQLEIRQHDSVAEKVSLAVRPRGVFRRQECDPPQLFLDFAADSLGRLRKLGKMKMVHACLDDDYNNQLLLRELLVYKMYEKLTPLSFRTHLIQVVPQDPSQRKYSRWRYAFFLEDVDDVADRNLCKELGDERFSPEGLERNDYLRFAIFQYMIANPDWSISLVRNVKLVKPKGVKNSMALPIPYDFDFAGLVNAAYAAPSENLPITSVRERLYMGPKMTEEEMNNALAPFRNNRMVWLRMIEAFSLMDARNRKDCRNFIESFFAILDDSEALRNIFVRG